MRYINLYYITLHYLLSHSFRVLSRYSYGLFSNLYTSSKLMNVLDISLCLLLTKFLLLLNLPSTVILSLFSRLIKLALHLSSSSVTITWPPSTSCLKITNCSFRWFRHASLAFGINFPLHSVNLILIILLPTCLIPIIKLISPIITTVTVHYFYSFSL